MTVYDAAHIRNVALVGHQGCGKTTLAEAMLYSAGAVPRMGTVEDGSTVSDFHESERERGMGCHLGGCGSITVSRRRSSVRTTL